MLMEAIFKRSAVTKVLTHSRCLVMMERRSCFPATAITGEPMTRIFLSRIGLSKTNWEIGSLGSARDWEIGKLGRASISDSLHWFRTSATSANPDSHRDGRASPKALPVVHSQRTSAAFARASAAKRLPTSDFLLDLQATKCQVMYNFLLLVHNFMRWVILLLLVIA